MTEKKSEGLTKAEPTKSRSPFGGYQPNQESLGPKIENKDLSGEAWYVGINVRQPADSRETCTLLMSYLGVGPRSKGVEYILTALEGPGDNSKKARCLGEVIEYLANDPSDYYRRLRTRDTDYTSEHGFYHRADNFYEALSIDRDGQMEVNNIVLEIGKGITESIVKSGRLTAAESSRVFEEILDSHSKTDKKIIAAAIYAFLTAPPQKPKTFGPPIEFPSSPF